MNPNKKRNWTPYILLLPSLVYLALFFAWPMVRSMALAFYADETVLNLHQDAALESEITGQVRQTNQVVILGVRGNPVAMDIENSAGTELWYRIKGDDANGQRLEGWVLDRRIREAAPETEGGVPTSGTVRRPRSSTAEPRIDLYAEPGVITESIGKLEADTEVAIVEIGRVEIWYQVKGEGDAPVEGWAQAAYLEPNDAVTSARVASGDTGEFTLKFIERMVTDRLFDDAIRTTFLLMIIIIPIQFVLAIIMALVLQAQLRGNMLFLYFFAIPLGVSDLAVGIVWRSIFEQSGYINSFLVGTGLIKSPFIFINPETPQWMILAIVLAEVWRATSIVMVIVVSGLQAVPTEYLEAAELFGAGLWQRLRYVILPLLKPSLQVALILRTILAFQVFAVVIAIAGRSMTVLANETFRWYDEFRNPNVAAAYAGFILLLSMFTAVFYLRAVRTQEEMAE